MSSNQESAWQKNESYKCEYTPTNTTVAVSTSQLEITSRSTSESRGAVRRRNDKEAH